MVNSDGNTDSQSKNSFCFMNLPAHLCEAYRVLNDILLSPFNTWVTFFAI